MVGIDATLGRGCMANTERNASVSTSYLERNWDSKSSQLVKTFIGLVKLDSSSPASNRTWSDNCPSCRKHNIIDYCDS